METRAPYAIIGLFVLAAIGAVLGFVYWLNNTGGLGERRIYRVQFDTSVSGLLVGASVLFNGIRVGEVTELKLPPGKSKQVVATISVAAATPVRQDTKAGLEFQGLTGVPVIALEGGSDDKSIGGDLVLVADPAASQSMTLAARNALVRVDNLMAENASGVRDLVDQPEDVFRSPCAQLRTYRRHSWRPGENDWRWRPAGAEDDLRSGCADGVSAGQGVFARAARGR